MREAVAAIICCWIGSTFAWAADPGSDESRFWPQWRGPDATGVANHADPPIEWSKNKNIRW
ncbi:MAG: hypothetical protein ABIF82_04385, partial [Planctomycetota bacterium]